jgi:voltage-gated potassium channel Kch
MENLGQSLKMKRRGGSQAVEEKEVERVLKEQLDKEIEEEEEEDIKLPFYIQIMKYMCQVLNLIDLVAILPFYVQQGLKANIAGGQFVRILRLARIFRIFKVGKNSKGIAMLVSTMKQSFGALSIVGFFVTLGIVFFGSIEFFFEGGVYSVQFGEVNGTATGVPGYYRVTQAGVNGPPVGAAYEITPFVDIPASMYWAVVTSTTVGYGDLFPTSVGGRIVAGKRTLHTMKKIQ